MKVVGDLAMSDTNHRPRRLLIRLTSEENATHILTAAKRLRHSDDQYVATSVYINRDLSPTEAKLAYEKREQRRARKQSMSMSMSMSMSTVDLYSASPRPPLISPALLVALSRNQRTVKKAVLSQSLKHNPACCRALIHQRQSLL